MLKLLRNIIQEASSAQDLEEALGVIVARVRAEIHTQACSIFLVNQDQSALILMATDGLDPTAIKKATLPIDNSLGGLVATQGETINLDDATKHPKFFSSSMGEELYRAYLGVPIKFRRKLLGIITVQQQEARCYDEAEEAFLMTIAVQLARLIEPYIETSDVLRKISR